MNTPTNRDISSLTENGPTSAPSTMLLALADRCEREEPSQELDEEIWQTLPSWAGLKPFTTSLDSAVTLIPEHCEWSELGRHVEWGEPSPLTGSCEREYCVTISLMDATGNFLGNSVHGATETLPMSICAAALRARAALVQS